MQFDRFYKDVAISLLNENSLPEDVFHYPSVTNEPSMQNMLLRNRQIKPLLNDMVREQILADIENLNSVDMFKPRRVQDFVLVGDILRPFFNVKKDAQIDIVVYYDTRDFPELMHFRLQKALSIINDRYITGTKRKIYYHIRSTPINLKTYSAVYHPYTNKWLKEPESFNINL